MLYKTHLAIGTFVVILFFPLVNNPISFSIMVLMASLLPDIDTAFSKIGRNPFSKLIQVFTEHRGMLHSLTACFVISIILSIFFPLLAFGFFLGYSVHLLADSFTKAGVTVFWPYSRIAKGMIRTGGVVERGIFFTFTILDVLFALIYLI